MSCLPIFQLVLQFCAISNVCIKLQYISLSLMITYLCHAFINFITVEINYAPSPLDTEYLVGDIEAKMFDERGGVFHSYKHGVTVIVPPEAIPSGILAELKFAATVVASVKFTDVTPVSAIYWLCMDVTLKKPIQVRLPQKFVENDASTLQFAKSLHSSTKVIEPIMGVIDGGKFNALENHAHIEVNHFCYYCIVRKLDPSKIPRNKYLVVAMKCYEKEKIWRVDICVLPLIKTCLEVSSMLQMYKHNVATFVNRVVTYVVSGYCFCLSVSQSQGC